MTQSEKVQRVTADLAARGIPLRKAVPLPWRLLWRAGFVVPPPLFLGFRTCAILHGCIGGALTWLVIGFVLAPERHASFWFALFIAVVCGAIIGAMTAEACRDAARKLELPEWRTYADP